MCRLIIQVGACVELSPGTPLSPCNRAAVDMHCFPVTHHARHARGRSSPIHLDLIFVLDELSPPCGNSNSSLKLSTLPVAILLHHLLAGPRRFSQIGHTLFHHPEVPLHLTPCSSRWVPVFLVSKKCLISPPGQKAISAKS